MTIRIQHHQKGVVLLTSLIMLVLLTLLAAAIIKSGVIDLKIGGAHQIMAQNLSSAEAEVMTYVNFENANNRNWINPHVPVDVTYDDGYGLNITTVHLELDAGGDCANPAKTQFRSSLYEIHRRIRATATGVMGGRTVINQGIRATSVSCS